MPALAIGGLGGGLSFPAVTNVALPGVGERDAGGASGVVNTAFQLGAATGVAVLGAVFFGLVANHADASARAVAPQIRSELQTAHMKGVTLRGVEDGFNACFHARMTAKDPTAVPAVCRRTWSAAGTLIAAARDAQRDDFRHAFRRTLWWEVGVFLLGLALAVAVPRPARGTRETVAEPVAG
jgi:hypothetical protein